MISEFDPDSHWRLFYIDRPTLLYYVKFTYRRKSYYKIGITTKTVEQRFANEKRKFEIIATRQFSNGLLAYTEEQRILAENYEYKYYGRIFLRSGYSELFTKDVLKGKL